MTETELKDAAWYYPETFEKANHIKNYVAFCMLLIAQETYSLLIIHR